MKLYIAFFSHSNDEILSRLLATIGGWLGYDMSISHSAIVYNSMVYDLTIDGVMATPYEYYKDRLVLALSPVVLSDETEALFNEAVIERTAYLPCYRVTILSLLLMLLPKPIRQRFSANIFLCTDFVQFCLMAPIEHHTPVELAKLMLASGDYYKTEIEFK